MIVDPGTFHEWDRELEISNPLQFPGYEKKILAAQEKTKLNEAIVTGQARIGGYPAVVGVCDARFLMSSMGHNVEKRLQELWNVQRKNNYRLFYLHAPEEPECRREWFP